MTKVTVETCYGKYSIEMEGDDHSYGEFLRDFIVPISLAMSYQPGTIEQFIDVDSLD